MSKQIGNRIYLSEHSTDIKELQKWLEEQIKSGKTSVNLEIEWGYYNSIDYTELVAF